jgi:hypothetical protein
MHPRPKPATIKSNTAQSQPGNTKDNHETEGGSVAIDDEAIAF